MAKTGTIFKYERYAIHDGPGIRTVVFFKGCPLKCKWCSSPESWYELPEIKFNPDNCTQCYSCIDVCPQKAISVSIDKKIVTDLQLCQYCGTCAQVCTPGARKIIGIVVDVKEVLHEIDKDSVFYHRSGGGVTFSGGEPTMQFAFLKGILEGCLIRGIHTAIETCGYVKWDNFNQVIPYLDLIYLDIKHILVAKHRNLTGKSNDLILANLERIDQFYSNKSVIVRIPIVTGVNDDIKNIKKIADFLGKLKVVKKIEILPYHRYGLNMYKALSKEYALDNVKVPSTEHIKLIRDILQLSTIPVQIGG